MGKLQPHRLLPLRKLPLRKLLQQPQRLPPQPNTQRGIAHRQPKRQPLRSHQPKRQPQTVRQQVAIVMRAVLNASLSLETTRQRSILIACLVEEIPCNLGGHAMTTSASAKLAETFLYKRG